MGSKSSNRRELLQGSAIAVGAVATGAVGSLVTPALADTTKSYALNNSPMIGQADDLLAYGQRSKYVKSIRYHEYEKPEAVLARYRDFGLTLHINAPIGDFMGQVAPNSIHYFATTKGTLLPDIDPKEHTLTVQGLVDRPLILTMEDLKRFPSVSRFHYVECAANNHTRVQKTVQASHGFTSNAEWTGVLLSTLLKEAGVKSNAKWFIAEGAEEIKGADTLPLDAMNEMIIAYGMNGEPVRPHNGYPLRLIAPGFEGIFNTKWLRRIDVVENYMLNMDDYGHLRRDAAAAALGYVGGPKSVITFPSGDQKLPSQGWYEISGLAWSGQGKVAKVEITTDGGKTWKEAELQGTPPNNKAHTRFGMMFKWEGGEHIIASRLTDSVGSKQLTGVEAAKHFGVPYVQGYRPPGLNNLIMAWKIGKDGAVTNGLDGINV